MPVPFEVMPYVPECRQSPNSRAVNRHLDCNHFLFFEHGHSCIALTHDTAFGDTQPAAGISEHDLVQDIADSRDKYSLAESMAEMAGVNGSAPIS